jgi:hypothetical protein
MESLQVITRNNFLITEVFQGGKRYIMMKTIKQKPYEERLASMIEKWIDRFKYDALLSGDITELFEDAKIYNINLDDFLNGINRYAEVR